MKNKPLFWQLYPSLLIVTFLEIFVLIGFARHSFRDFYLEDQGAQLEEKLNLLSPLVLSSLQDKRFLQRNCLEMGEIAHTRITLVNINGQVLCDSKTNPQEMKNQKNSHEIKMALQGLLGKSVRRSLVLDRPLLYIAIPLKKNNQIIAVLRGSFPMEKIEQAIETLTLKFGLTGVILAIILIFVNLWLSRKISYPLEIMKSYAQKMAMGDFNIKVELPGNHSREVFQLADSMNDLGNKLDKQFNKIVKQRNEREAVFSSMREGVLSLYIDGNIMHWNKAVLEMFGISIHKDFKGSPLRDVFSNPILEEIRQKIHNKNQFIEEEITLTNNRIVQIHGTPIYSSANEILGTLMVFYDITRLRQLESHRKQFVANVSHELRTPLTAIQGFIETLLDEENIEPPMRQKFLGIVSKHATRLNAIIEDLLMLSKIEQESEIDDINFQILSANSFILPAIEVCEKKALDKNIEFKIDIDGEIKILGNSNLLEQAMVNLIDNAIKYGPADTQVKISAQGRDNNLLLIVEDQGPGIPEKHHQRLFERFYSVDKARSRNLGGSGLGLSIVKHIALIHKGQVGINHAKSQGSLFFIEIPKA